MSAEHPNLARDPAAASDPISAETDPNAAPDTDVATVITAAVYRPVALFFVELSRARAREAA
jgi:hypothetical protein